VPPRFLAIVLIGFTAATSLAAGGQAGTAVARTAFFTAVDQKGNYVDDLGPADLTVRDGGRVREILRTGPSSLRLKINLVIDDTLALNDTVRGATVTFVERMQSSADLALYLTGGSGTSKLVDFNASPVRFRQVLNELPRRSQGGGNLVESLYRIIGDTHRLEGRRVVVILTTETPQRTTVTANGVLDQLRDTGAVLYAATLAVTGAIEPPTPEMAHLEVMEEIERDRVLNDGPRQSGGLRLPLLNMEAFAGALDRIARELGHQHMVTYVIPAGAKTDGSVSIASQRKGVTVRGPRQLPKI